MEYHNNLRLHELFWRQKFRVNWMRADDRNTSFFHRSTIVRRAKISLLWSNEHGENVVDQENISALFLAYCRDRWVRPFNETWGGDLSYLKSPLTEAHNGDLCKMFTLEEIEEVVRQLPNDKAPRPDGISVEFYTNFGNNEGGFCRGDKSFLHHSPNSSPIEGFFCHPYPKGSS